MMMMVNDDSNEDDEDDEDDDVEEEELDTRPSANPCAFPRSLLTVRYPHLLQVRGDLEDYSRWKLGILRYVKFMSRERKCPTM